MYVLDDFCAACTKTASQNSLALYCLNKLMWKSVPQFSSTVNFLLSFCNFNVILIVILPLFRAQPYTTLADK